MLYYIKLIIFFQNAWNIDDSKKKFTIEKVGNAWKNWKTRLTAMIRPYFTEPNGFETALSLRPSEVEEQVWLDFVINRFSEAFQVYSP